MRSTYSVCRPSTKSQLSLSMTAIELLARDSVCRLVRLYIQSLDTLVSLLLSSSLGMKDDSRVLISMCVCVNS